MYSGGREDSETWLTPFSDVLRYNPDTDQWEKIGDLDTPRWGVGASAVKWNVVAPFC